MKKVVSLILMLTLLSLIAGCATYHYEGAAAGGVVGGIAGALLDHKNPWRGGLIGAGLGGAFGATIADVSVRGSRQAAYSGRPVEYRTEDGRGRYYAEPVGQPYYPNEQTKCRKVHERVWEDGRIVKDQLREVCEGERIEQRY